jgi:S-adenosylmethionine hydrolase
VPRITLLTDFGTRDGYVAAVKGVLAERAPGVLIDDATHDIPPGDIRSAAWALSRYWRLFPAGTVHLAVVDPGVGSDRRALAARVAGRLLVAPDNGVLGRVLDECPPDLVVSLENPEYRRPEPSCTFHARDIFAPAAAALALGVPLEELGPPVADPIILPLPRPDCRGDAARGVVVHVDTFGNLITNLPERCVRAATTVRIGGRPIGPLRRAYAEVEPGRPLALIGSAGLLEVAVRDGNAASVLGVGLDAVVEVASAVECDGAP